jgi:hypothetical protein
MLHFHGTPITPRAKLLELAGRCFCVRYGAHGDLRVCHEIGQSVMLDNGAFSFWRQGKETDWEGYYHWCEPWLDYQTTWAVIPDVIDGNEDDNDALLSAWSQRCLPRGAPVWHLHEPIDRLRRLCHNYPRVCLGSSGQYATVGNDRWHRRMEQAMNAVCGNGAPGTWLHMLRGLSLAGSHYPFASADSTLIAQNHAGNNTRATPRKDVRAMADRIDGLQCPARWRISAEQPELSAA